MLLNSCHNSLQAALRRCCFQLVLLASLCGLFGVATAQEGAPKPDVRLVIDVSGSMKRNDPNNLRQPAVDLLVRMVPDGAKAGVWTFGQHVNMLVPHQVVDPTWREAASRKSAEINSVGLFTNIGGALETAAHDIKRPQAGYVTSIILLTDGMVDISKSAAENEAEWRRVVEQVFPALKEAGYKVHAVALSDDADKSLMEKLALTTAGTFAVAKTADDLMKIFLQAFDLAVPSQKVPLVNNRFLVDSSVNEFTALIFRKDHSEQTRLIGPDEVVLQAANPPEDVRWLRTEEYDLITVRKPYEGEWQIIAAIEPESRVTVVSNLALRVKSLPSNSFRGAEEQLSFVLLADGKPVTDKTFLNLLEGRVSLAHGVSADAVAAPFWSTTVAGSTVQENGVFNVDLPMLDKMGMYDLQLTVDGKTFLRQFSHRITVREPFSAALEQAADPQGVMQHTLTVRAHSDLIDPQQTQIAATIVSPARRRLVRPLELIRAGEWQTVVPMDLPGEYKITIQVTGTDKRKDPFDYALTPISFTQAPDPAFASTPQVNQDPAPVEEPEPPPAEAPLQPTEQPAAEPPAEVSPPPGPDGSIPSWLLYLLLAAGNLVVLGGGYWLFRKLMSDDSEEAPEDVEPPPAKPAPVAEELPLKMDEADAQEEEPPMEDLTDDAPPVLTSRALDMDDELLGEDLLPEDLEQELVEQVMGDEPEASKEDFAAEIRRAQGLDLDESELDDAITTLIDELDGEPRAPSSNERDEMDDFDLDDDRLR